MENAKGLKIKDQMTMYTMDHLRQVFGQKLQLKTGSTQEWQWLQSLLAKFVTLELYYNLYMSSNLKFNYKFSFRTCDYINFDFLDHNF